MNLLFLLRYLYVVYDSLEVLIKINVPLFKERNIEKPIASYFKLFQLFCCCFYIYVFKTTLETLGMVFLISNVSCISSIPFGHKNAAIFPYQYRLCNPNNDWPRYSLVHLFVLIVCSLRQHHYLYETLVLLLLKCLIT